MTPNDKTRRAVAALGSRAAGVLCHVTSLPGPDGIGTCGAPALGFVDWLADQGFGIWQILPVTAPGWGGSPYSGRSAFAANALLIDLPDLVDRGLLDRGDLAGAPSLPAGRADFDAVAAHKLPLLERAATALLTSKDPALGAELEAFTAREGPIWLDDAALFFALSAAENDRPWWRWDEPRKRRERGALDQTRSALRREIDVHRAVQFLFDMQWRSLRAHAVRRGVILFGDVPIYVSRGAADVWSHPEWFALGPDLEPRAVAGVPPDCFSETGQLWGDPVYDWPALAAAGYAFWIDRLRRATDLCDVMRLDHFRGFSAFWEVPAKAPDARSGRWAEGPRDDLFAAVRRELGGLPLVAEDLGDIDEDVRALRARIGIPGMAVLEFAFGGPSTSEHLPHNHVPASVVYTGTHDNDTLGGWWRSLDADARRHVRRYTACGQSAGAAREAMIRLALGSVAGWAVLPIQDVLGLGRLVRMNHPGRPGRRNWRFRLKDGDLDGPAARSVADLLPLFDRARLFGSAV